MGERPSSNLDCLVGRLGCDVGDRMSGSTSSGRCGSARIAAVLDRWKLRKRHWNRQPGRSAECRAPLRLARRARAAGPRRWVRRAVSHVASQGHGNAIAMSWTAQQPRSPHAILLRVRVYAGQRPLAASAPKRVVIRPPLTVKASLRQGTVEAGGPQIVSVSGEEDRSRTVVLAPGARAPSVGADWSCRYRPNLQTGCLVSSRLRSTAATAQRS